jgi:hypothetical protein
MSERFWAKVDKRGPDECWEWTAARSQGYGVFYVDGNNKTEQATRVVRRITHGVAVPRGLHVCHRCDNTGCVNPAHLFLGTAQDNLADMRAKGRSAYGVLPGERNGFSKLTEQQVRDIRATYALCRVTQRELAKRFGVCRATISYVVRRIRWAHLLELA